MTELKSNLTIVKVQRNPMFKSITDGFIDEPEKGFPPSICDSSQYESVQSIEARCMRGEIMLQKNPWYEYEGDVTEADLDVEDPEYDELDHFDQQAEQLHEQLQQQAASQTLPTGNEEQSGNSKASEATTLPVDNSVNGAIAAGD